MICIYANCQSLFRKTTNLRCTKYDTYFVSGKHVEKLQKKLKIFIPFYANMRYICKSTFKMVLTNKSPNHGK